LGCEAQQPWAEEIRFPKEDRKGRVWKSEAPRCHQEGVLENLASLGGEGVQGASEANPLLLSVFGFWFLTLLPASVLDSAEGVWLRPF